jgi:hypothetical protein
MVEQGAAQQVTATIRLSVAALSVCLRALDCLTTDREPPPSSCDIFVSRMEH